jgi:hypothetical protein
MLPGVFFVSQTTLLIVSKIYYMGVTLEGDNLLNYLWT